jgi:hypothetical protein
MARTTDLVALVNAKDLGARGACQGRASGERSERTLDTPKRSRTIEQPERRDDKRYVSWNAARVRSIGLAPSRGRIGVCERNRINSSGDSGSVRRAFPD